MKNLTGPWVSGDDFFNRELELALLERYVTDGNHILVAGQRRMGKTSVIQQLGQRLQAQGWTFCFADMEDAPDEQEAVADIAQAVHSIRASRQGLRRRFYQRFRKDVEEVSLYQARAKFRAETSAGNWRRRGEQLIRACANHSEPVFLVLDELPIFLKQLQRKSDGTQRVERFLSWLRKILQEIDGKSPVVIVSGSIGLVPLTRRLGITDRINYLHRFRVGPWDLETTVGCFNRLAESYALEADDGVAEAVYQKLGIGIPQHVQSFFALLRDHSVRTKRRVTLADVDFVYKHRLLGPQGQIDLEHYASRLKEALEDEYGVAMEILATAAIQGEFAVSALQPLGRQVYAGPERMGEVIDILVHDGYLERSSDSYVFASNLLRDWWAARFKNHFVPLDNPPSNS